MSEPLWAPWRMEYILSKKEGGCIFCTHAEADETVFAQEHVLVATDHALVLLNKYPFAAGHLLVIPRRHAGELETLSDVEFDALFRLTRDASTRLFPERREPVLHDGERRSALVVGLRLLHHQQPRAVR